MARMTHLTRRGAVYWFRYKLPSDLSGKAILGDDWPGPLAMLVRDDGKGGQRLKVELTQSLATKDEKTAKRRALAKALEVEHLCEDARRWLAGHPIGLPDGGSLTPERREALADSWRATILAIDDETRKQGITSVQPLLLGEDGANQERGMTDADLAIYKATIATQETDARKALATLRPQALTKIAAKSRLKAAGIAMPNSSPALRDVEIAFAAAERKALGEVRARLEGEAVPTPRLGTQRGGKEGAPKLSVTFDRWARGNPTKGAKKPSAAAISEGETALRRFIELHGDLPVTAITKRHARELLDALALVPKGLPPELRALPLRRLLKRDLSGYAQRSAATVNKAMQILGGVLTRAERDGFFDDAGAWGNPFHISIPVNDTAQEPYQPFDVNELNALFASPVFAKGERPKGGAGDAAYWLPVLSLFTGARRTELAQLVAGDVRQDTDTGVWFIAFHNDGENTLKTRASKRTTPVHPVLVSLGFLAFAQSRLQSGGSSAPLMPAFSRPIAPKAKAWTKWFSRYLSRHVVDHPAKSFHSFRGTFKRFARAACEEHAIDALCGHAGQTVGRRYGRKPDASGAFDAGFPMARLAAEIAKVEFPGLALPLWRMSE